MMHATYLGTHVYLHALAPIRHECLPCRKNRDVAKMTYYMYFYQSEAEMQAKRVHDMYLQMSTTTTTLTLHTRNSRAGTRGNSHTVTCRRRRAS